MKKATHISISLQKQLNAAAGKMLLNIDFNIEQGKFITIYGNSGAGKTSILRMIAGLLTPGKGQISVNDNIWLDTEKGIRLTPQQRKIGFVFQDYALFPNMTVVENLTFALDKGQELKIISELIDIMELGELANKKPITLSGGQQQRVALARALVRKPDILMLDEPLSSLDIKMRSKLQDYIMKVHRAYNLTTILVSHDISEIIKMSDYIYELSDGKIINQGNPKEVLTGSQVNEPIQIIGEIIAIANVGIIQALVGNDVIEIPATEIEVEQLSIGDKILISQKLVNPTIRKIRY